MKKLVLATVVLVAAAVAGLHFLLAYRLNEAVQNRVLPAIREETGLNVRLDSVSVNLAAGSLTFQGFHASNPEGFAEQDMLSLGRVSIRMGLLPLLRGGGIEIRKARARDGLLSLVRERDGRINVQEAAGLMQPGVAAAPRATGVEPLAAPIRSVDTASGMPDLKIGDLRAGFLVQYTDHALFAEGLRLSAEIDLRMKNIANYGPTDALSGAVTAAGRILGHGNSGMFHLDGMVGPVSDPMTASFVASIGMEDLVLDIFGTLAENQGLTPASVSGKLNLQCERGVFNPAKSELRLTFHDTRFTEKLRARMGGIEGLESITVVAPIGGTLAAPEIDFQGAIRRGLMSDEVVEAVLRSMMEREGRAPALLRDVDIGAESNGKKPGRSRTIDIEGIFRDIRRGPR